MSMTAEQLAELEIQLGDLLIAKGWAQADADEIIDAASAAAHQGIASMVAAAGSAQPHNRDSAIILALYIMQRLALSDDSLPDPGKLPGIPSDADDAQDTDRHDTAPNQLRAC